jgi:hypothetical protein
VPAVEHAAHHAMHERDEIAAFHDRCSDLMRALLDELAITPDRPRTFPQVEDALGWPRRRIASVLGGACRMRQMQFGGRRPYRFYDERNAASGRWEIWMDAAQAHAVLSSDSEWSLPAAGTAPAPAGSARAESGSGRPSRSSPAP